MANEKKNKQNKKSFDWGKSNAKSIWSFLKRVFFGVWESIYSFWKKAVLKLKDKTLLKKILYSVILIFIFRIAATITIPGVIVNNDFGQDSSSFIGILDLMGGGALTNFSIVALGISPYITSSIIMSLLQSEAFPPLYRLSKAGLKGKRKLNVITRCITFVFAIMQAITIIQQLSTVTAGLDPLVTLQPAIDTNLFKFLVIPAILVGGSMFTLFLGEQITNRGAGNGTSLIIFSGVVANLPAQINNAYYELAANNSEQATFIGWVNFIVYLGVFVILIFIISYFYKAERHVPIQQTGSGLVRDYKQLSKLPIKLNPAGVIPVIFALTIAVLPLTIVQFLHHQDASRIWVENNLTLTDPIGLYIFILIILVFSVMMALVTFNPFTVSENLKKNNSFIPGIRPGDDTENYLINIVTRLGVFSAIYLSIISSIQYIEQIIGLSPSITIGGTSLIIMVSVAIETMDQIKARNTTQKISKAKIRSIANAGNDTNLVGEGFLW